MKYHFLMNVKWTMFHWRISTIALFSTFLCGFALFCFVKLVYGLRSASTQIRCWRHCYEVKPKKNESGVQASCISDYYIFGVHPAINNCVIFTVWPSLAPFFICYNISGTHFTMGDAMKVLLSKLYFNIGISIACSISRVFSWIFIMNFHIYVIRLKYWTALKFSKAITYLWSLHLHRFWLHSDVNWHFI